MNIFEIEVHPAADIFPMIPRDELAELAADIAENGLIHPIVVKDNVLIDGRNRRAACEMVDIVPEVVELNGDDIYRYVISSNVKHRRITKGQSAMAEAMVNRMAKHGGAREKGASSNLEHGGARLSEARLILSHSESLAKQVMAGSMPFDTALTEAKDAIKKEKENAIKMDFLENEYPELLSLVIEESLTLDDAWAVRETRDADQIARVDGFNRQMKGLLFEADVLSIDKNAVHRLSSEIKEQGENFDHRSYGDIEAAKNAIVQYRDNLTKLIEEF